jgi:hypothetical protein
VHGTLQPRGSTSKGLYIQLFLFGVSPSAGATLFGIFCNATCSTLKVASATEKPALLLTELM